jgi:predicted metal-dependent hydrolase
MTPLDWNCGGLAEGLACYRRTEFFEAHEHWESVWLRLEEPEKSFLQALIQIAAAFHHLQAGNRAGAVSLLSRALARLESRPAQFGGIAVGPLRVEVRAWIEKLEGAAAAPKPAFPRPFPNIDPIRNPQIDECGRS